jgi:prephenate dehydratase
LVPYEENVYSVGALSDHPDDGGVFDVVILYPVTPLVSVAEKVSGTVSDEHVVGIENETVGAVVSTTNVFTASTEEILSELSVTRIVQLL